MTPAEAAAAIEAMMQPRTIGVRAHRGGPVVASMELFEPVPRSVRLRQAFDQAAREDWRGPTWQSVTLYEDVPVFVASAPGPYTNIRQRLNAIERASRKAKRQAQRHARRQTRLHLKR